MKECPECKRIYRDETLNFCLDDGAALLNGPAHGNEPSTAVLPGSSPSEAPTRYQTENKQEQDRTTSDLTKNRLVLAILLPVILLGAGYLGYRYLHTSSNKPIDSIAVMPFTNESGNPDIEYLSDGMTESLISSLSQLGGVKVKARSSVFKYKDRPIDPSGIGKELSVDAVLVGRLVQQANNVTLYVELVNTSSGDTLWKQDYTRPLSNLVQMQDQLAKDVALRLRQKLSGSEEASFVRSHTSDPEAYNLYLLGRYHLNRLTDDGFRKGVQYFREAVAKDPNFALAYTGLADAYNRLGGFNAAPPRDTFPAAKEASLRALEIDNLLAEAHSTLATVKFFYDWDWAGAEGEYKRSIELDPANADAHQSYGMFLGAMRRFPEALSELKLARELDPLSLEKQMAVGDVYYLQRQYDDALREYRKTLEMDPNSGIANWSIGLAFLHSGKYDEAISSLQKANSLSGDSPDESIELARALILSGQREEALKIIRELESLMSRKYISPTALGTLYIELGDNDKGFQLFETALRERDFLLVLANVDPLFDKAKADPRFSGLARRVGLPQ
jgi:serine/threonine-protein kinase